MKNNQGKTPQQYRDSARFSLIGYSGIIILMSIIFLMSNCKMGDDTKTQKTLNDSTFVENFNIVDSLRKTGYEDWDQITMLTLDSVCNVLDSVDNRKIERWEGKEGKSEYGQYEPSDNWNQGPCGYDYEDWNEHHYIDEEVMWIGNDGDTIWE